MHILRLSVVLLFTILQCGGTAGGQTTTRSATATPETVLTRMLRKAKADERKEITIPAASIPETGVESVQDVLREYTILRFELVDRIVIPGDDGLRTWYKLRVMETLARQVDVSAEPLPVGVPTSFLPLAEDETIFTISGGTLVVDGVTVRHGIHEDNPRLERNSQYIGCFQLDYGGKLALPAVGAAGMFRLVDGDMKAQGPESHPLVREVKRLYGNRYGEFRLDVERRTGMPTKPAKR